VRTNRDREKAIRKDANYFHNRVQAVNAAWRKMDEESRKDGKL